MTRNKNVKIYYTGMSYAPDASIPTGRGIIDLANVQGFLAIDGLITVSTRNPDKTSGINLIGGPPGDQPGSPSYNIIVNGDNIAFPRLGIDRINIIGSSQPTSVLSIKPFALGSSDSTLTMKGAVFPSYVAFIRRINDVGNNTLNYNAQYPLLFTSVTSNTTLNIKLAVIPATGSIFCTLIDTNGTGLYTQTINFKSADGSVTYGTVTSTGLSKIEVTCFNNNAGSVSLAYWTIPIGATGSGNFPIPAPAVIQMNDTLDKIQKGTLNYAVP